VHAYEDGLVWWAFAILNYIAGKQVLNSTDTDCSLSFGYPIAVGDDPAG
jgi:hypothetical protein